MNRSIIQECGQHDCCCTRPPVLREIPPSHTRDEKKIRAWGPGSECVANAAHRRLPRLPDMFALDRWIIVLAGSRSVAMSVSRRTRSNCLMALEYCFMP